MNKIIKQILILTTIVTLISTTTVLTMADASTESGVIESANSAIDTSTDPGIDTSTGPGVDTPTDSGVDVPTGSGVDTPTDAAVEPPVITLKTPKLKVKSAKSKQITLTWKKVTNANKYILYQKKGKGKWKKLKTFTTKTKFTKKKLKLKKTYSYKMRVKNGDVYSKYSPVVKKIKIKGKYKQPTMYGNTLTKKQLRKVRDKVANFVNKNQTWKLNQADKADLAAAYIASNVKYQDGGKNKFNRTAYGALIRNKGNCSAYMRGFKALADAMGLKCKCVKTRVSWNGHQWNHVKVDGTWYILDTQNGYWIGIVKKPNRNNNDLFGNYRILKS